MTQIPIILLAAGQSRRMRGADKLLKEIDGCPLLLRSAQTARAASSVIVALPSKPHPRYDVLQGLDLHLVEIADAEEGMNASLRGALSAVGQEAEAVMVLLADLPEITLDDLQTLIKATKAYPDKLIWRGSTASGQPGHPVIFSRLLFDQISRLTGDEGAQSVVRDHRDKVHLCVLPGQHAVLDLDTPEAWDIWTKNRNS
ncbi:nucleotidyltransferase family protein [Ruegeria faecimaris]|uniref:nucleotidyltransferase family protein n=1 Tax=Ruegeria faecimaris TaxID=686389 RepID=UPI002490F008|nr:nucleotidyltransferase family protein [Ruegeria faecimaris]